MLMPLLHLPRICQTPIKICYVTLLKDRFLNTTTSQQMSFSSMNNWGKLKIELVPWVEWAFVLICQGLFKKAALAGSFAAIGKQV